MELLRILGTMLFGLLMLLFIGLILWIIENLEEKPWRGRIGDMNRPARSLSKCLLVYAKDNRYRKNLAITLLTAILFLLLGIFFL